MARIRTWFKVRRDLFLSATWKFDYGEWNDSYVIRGSFLALCPVQ